MSELQVSTEVLRQEAEKTVSDIRKMKQVLDKQRAIIRRMGGYWKGEGYDTATKTYMALSNKSYEVLNQLEDIPTRLFDIAEVYEDMERVNKEITSELPSSLLE
jgi:hypothetical protein